MAKKRSKRWVSSSSTPPASSSLSATARSDLETKAKDLIEKELKLMHVQSPPPEPRFNYVIDLVTKWHGRYFYFVAIYACPEPNAISPTFETNFARLEPVGVGRFNLAFMRHTEKWHELYTGLTLDECLNSIRDDPWFHP